MNDFTQSMIILIKQLMDNPSMDYTLKRNILRAIDPDFSAIWWHYDDFEDLASRSEEQEEKPIGSMYDRSLFQDALQRMCEDADGEYGVNWYTVDHMLDEYCRKDDQ